MKRSDCVVCFSGGMDSTTLLYYVISKKKRPLAVSFDYDQRHRRELLSAKKICKKLGLPHKVIKIGLKQIGGSPLTDRKLRVPAQKERKQRLTVVPYRNTIMLSYAMAVAEVNKFSEVWIGACSDDWRNYRDCRESFFQSLEKTLSLGGTKEGTKVRIRRPFVGLDKVAIVKLGMKLNVPYELTWTCYEGRSKPCGRCDACREREEAFKANGLVDPLVSK